MTQYISKAAVVAEIKRLSAYLDTLHEQRIIEKILSIIDTIEVKEVDEPRYNGFMGKELQMVDDEIHRLENLKVKEVDLEKEWKEFLKDGDVGFKEIAHHFFEIGMSVSNKAQKK